MENTNNVFNLPVLPLRGLVIYPNMVVHLDVGRAKSIKVINDAMKTNQLIFVVAQKDPNTDEPTLDDVFKVGVIARVVQVLKETEDSLRVVVQGMMRAKFTSEFLDNKSKNLYRAQVLSIKEKKYDSTAKSSALIRSIKSTFERYLELAPRLPKDVMKKINISDNPGKLADYIASNIFLDLYTKQTILEVINPLSRLEILIQALENEIYIISIEQDILERAKDSIDRNQRDFLLREQKKIIEEELGENNEISEVQEFRNKINQLNANDEIKEYLLKECNKYEKSAFGNAEATMIANYLDTVLSLPWNVFTEENIDLDSIQKQLDKDHYGLKKVKSRIIESLAVKKLNPKSKGNIICLVGPPGTGKTSISVSIAKAIGRNHVRLSLGGVKDEAEIRGHRKTYIGAMPGRIINAYRLAKSSNPLIILDEIDKLSNDYKGDPTSALLEVLDPEQNYAFVDHYIDLPFDLSNTFFITTANDYDSIPAPLRDRMDVIDLSSYTRVEKFHIAKKHLLPKQIIENGIKRKNVKITDKAIYMLIDSYTKEAGVRNLERVIASLLRKVAVKVINDANAVVSINDTNIEEFLGPIKYLDDEAVTKNEIGITNGLAWTSVGGTILPIECTLMKGTGKVELTGSLGEVMQESAKIAISCIRTRANLFDIDPDFYKEYDIHIHAPDGATPKDGPSAGITMATALYSVLTSSPVRHDFAMTGEITLTGKVMPIGGLREKAMAAYKSKIKNVIIPKENLRDLYDIEDEVKDKLKFIPVSNIEEVIELVTIKPKKTETNRMKSVVDMSSKKSKRASLRQ